MKRKFLICIVVAALLIMLLPANVFAAEPMELKVFVRNTTGGVVELRLTNLEGKTQWLSLDPGVYKIDLMEGKYEYYALTPCGVQVGVWNLNVSKQLMVSCDGGMLSMDLSKRCDGGWWGVMYYDHLSNVHLFVTGDSTNLPDYDEEYFSWKVLSNFGVWPQWEKSEPMCWSDAGVGDFTYWVANVWYDCCEW